jgi:hypothetical protein
MTDRPTLKDLGATPDSGLWCCSGNAEDCALCTDPDLPYPFLCAGHPRTAASERIVGEATRATDGGKGVREVRIVVHAPSGENAGQWAETIRDLVVAEYGDSMRLEVTILPGGTA